MESPNSKFILLEKAVWEIGRSLAGAPINQLQYNEIVLQALRNKGFSEDSIKDYLQRR
jgi:hypothetical protein